MTIDEALRPADALSPARQVFVVLAESCRRGDGFDEAWLRAMRSLPRPLDPGWMEALHFARPHFCQEFEERAAMLAGRALLEHAA